MKHLPAKGSARTAVGRRTPAVIASATAAMLALSACGGAGSASGSDEVVLTLWDTDARTERTERLEHIIELFEAEHPGVTVEYVGLPTDSYMERIETAIATDTTPDLLTPKASDLSALVTQGALEPLDELMERDGYFDLVESSMVEAAQSAVADGKLYLTPSSSLTDVIWYRTDLFAEAGLGTPETWDDFFEGANELTDRDSGQFGYTIRGGSGFWPQFVGMVLPMAGVASYFDENGESVFDQPEVIEAARAYADLYGTTTAQSDVTADFRMMVAQFGGGSAAMLSHSIGSYPDHVAALGEENVGAAVAFPAENGMRVQSGLVLGFGMFADTEYPEESWEFLKFMMEEEANSYWAQESGYIPGNLAVAEQEWVSESHPISVSLEAMADPNTVPLEHPYYLPEFTPITATEMLPEWQAVLQGDQTIEEFCRKLAEAFNAAYADFQEREG